MQLTNKSLRPLPAGHPSTVTVTYVIISLRINLSLSGRDFTLGATLGTLQLTNATEGGDPLQQNPPFVPHPLCFFSSQQNENIFITEKKQIIIPYSRWMMDGSLLFALRNFQTPPE